MALTKLLEDSGFTEKEARVYLALLSFGQADVTEIAKAADLKRSIVYVILEGLIKRGYANLLPNSKVNTYQAIDPSVILNQLKILTKNFSEMLPLLRTLKNQGGRRPKISYHESQEGIWKIYEEMTQVEDAFFITSYTRIEKCFANSITTWISQWKKGYYKLKGRHLLPNNPRDIEIGREFLKISQRVRVLEALNEIHMDFAVYRNSFAITALEEEPFMVVIESEELVKSIRAIFEIVWERGVDVAPAKEAGDVRG